MLTFLKTLLPWVGVNDYSDFKDLPTGAPFGDGLKNEFKTNLGRG